jgi:hypothetical protein
MTTRLKPVYARGVPYHSCIVLSGPSRRVARPQRLIFLRNIRRHMYFGFNKKDLRRALLQLLRWQLLCCSSSEDVGVGRVLGRPRLGVPSRRARGVGGASRGSMTCRSGVNERMPSCRNEDVQLHQQRAWLRVLHKEAFGGSCTLRWCASRSS